MQTGLEPAHHAGVGEGIVTPPRSTPSRGVIILSLIAYCAVFWVIIALVSAWAVSAFL
jgi:hypothetical protein